MAGTITVKTPEKVGNWTRRLLRLWPDEAIMIEKRGGDYTIRVSGDHEKEVALLVASEYYRE